MSPSVFCAELENHGRTATLKAIACTTADEMKETKNGLHYDDSKHLILQQPRLF